MSNRPFFAARMEMWLDKRLERFFRSRGWRERVITYNDTQFTSRTFMQYIHDLDSKVCFASVAHPRSNGQAERANA